jgi:hypothetical protein
VAFGDRATAATGGDGSVTGAVTAAGPLTVADKVVAPRLAEPVLPAINWPDCDERSEPDVLWKTGTQCTVARLRQAITIKTML